MEVAPFFVDFHHFLSIFTIYALLSRFTFCRDLRTFSANILAKIAFSATSHVFCMYDQHEKVQHRWRCWLIWAMSTGFKPSRCQMGQLEIWSVTISVYSILLFTFHLIVYCLVNQHKQLMIQTIALSSSFHFCRCLRNEWGSRPFLLSWNGSPRQIKLLSLAARTKRESQ